jgi:RNA polymerase sigma-70 factor (ECF subfamily)
LLDVDLAHDGVVQVAQRSRSGRRASRGGTAFLLEAVCVSSPHEGVGGQVSVSLGLERQFEDHRSFLWGVCYRMTGNAADADDLVQETFVRALKTPPINLDEPLRPWLVRVAMNLSRDLLRRRKRRRYDGPWLPSPIETGSEASPASFEPAAGDESHPGARYDLLESVSLAFLLALEALTPVQRAVPLLRDVFDYSVREAAQALGMSEPAVKTAHHRARHAIRDYDRNRRRPTLGRQEATRRALEQFLKCLLGGDARGAEALLAEGVTHVSDSGGAYVAARLPVVGRDKVLLFYQRIVEQLGPRSSTEVRYFNGLPGLVTEVRNPVAGYAPRLVTCCEVDDEGRIARIAAVLAPGKLTAVR